MENQELTLDFLQTLENEFSGLTHLFERAVESSLPVALWKLPNQGEKHLIIDLTGNACKVKVDLEELGQGFAISPFLNQEGKESYLIRSDLHFRSVEASIKINPVLSIDQTDRIREILNKKPSGKARSSLKKTKPKKQAQRKDDKVDYQKVVSEALIAIERGEFQKVVPSRIKTTDLSENHDLIQIFLDACNNYRNAFVSLVSSTQTGTWMGVSPETLISVDRENIFRTASVAGTQRFNPEVSLAQVPWTQKEIEEQAFVSRYIINCFKKIRLREFEEIGPRTIKAANLIHLRTDYIVDMNAVNFPQLGTVMLDLLHPTSAVCGMPKEPALAFLQSHEDFDRRLYSGFLGPLNIDQESHLFVNLRCMQIFGDKVVLYAGAGITSDSIPEKEWEETEVKMETLLNLFN